jgi:molybdopterin-guanine dinucleotide biosynthesis adapter protein
LSWWNATRGGIHSKVEVYRAAIEKPPLYFNDAAIVAMATDEPLPGAKIPVVHLADVEATIEMILRHVCAC